MYRIISQLNISKGNGNFGLSKALHSTPRRYWELKRAISAAKKKNNGKGIHEILDDERNICAIVRDGQEVTVKVA